MTEIPEALVEKAARAITALYAKPTQLPLEMARAVLAAVTDDIARAERERVLAEVEAFAEKCEYGVFCSQCLYFSHKLRTLVAILRDGEVDRG